MKRFVGWAMSAGLVFVASAAHAQGPAPYRPVSDFQGPYERPYGAVPPAPPPVYDSGAYGAAPALLPPQEIYAILRDNGFSPLGVPQQRGVVYTIAAIDRNGEDGRLVIDARNGRIIRFMPAYGYGPYGQRRYDQGAYNPRPYEPGPYDRGFPLDRMSDYGAEDALPPPIVIRAAPRPPASVPHVASRGVPLPAPKPAVAGRTPDPTPQPSAAAAATRSIAPAAPTAHASAMPQGSATVGEAKSAPVIRPTQEMPKMQDLE
jgi:hypothetical protein